MLIEVARDVLSILSIDFSRLHVDPDSRGLQSKINPM